MLAVRTGPGSGIHLVLPIWLSNRRSKTRCFCDSGLARITKLESPAKKIELELVQAP